MKFETTTFPWVLVDTSTEGDEVISQGYLLGSAVTLQIKFTAVGTQQPLAPTTVVLDALVLAGTTLVTQTNTFITSVPGTYLTILDTTNYQAGSYTWRFLATDSSGHKFYGEDAFVLIAKTGPSG